MTDTPVDRPSIDPFFHVVHDGEWNACIGAQGGELNYVDGYMEAALELVGLVIDRKLWGHRDTLILPVLYNARHAIELALKFVAGRLHALGMQRDEAPLDHDILGLWTRLSQSRLGDRELRAALEALEPFVASLARVDGNGQELRYHLRRDGGLSLADNTIVNLRLVRASLAKLADGLQRLQYRILDLEMERPTGTHTADLSRTDLKALAGMLPPHAGWTGEAFDVARDQAMVRFGLGRRRFACAVDAIRRSRELATLVGIETPLRFLDDDSLLFVIAQWARQEPAEPIESEFGIVDVAKMLDEMDDDLRLSREIEQAVLDRLSSEQIADLKTVYYLGRERDLGEYYERRLDGNLREQQGGDRRWETVHHVMSKTNLREEVARGCALAGRPSLRPRVMAQQAGAAANPA